MQIRKNYTATIYASYVSYVVQAIVNNFPPLLFITFSVSYGITLDKIALISSLNFFVQLLTDAVSAKLINKLGYRKAIILAHISASLGMMGFGVFPGIMTPYAGIMTAMLLCAVGGGMIEVIISPLVEACPETSAKESAMSILHSFYCWGHVFTVLVSTLFFTIFGVNNWRILACVWAIVPFLNIFLFLLVPINSLEDNGRTQSITELFKNKLFWIMFLLMMLAGAAEQGISQWASAFAEQGLNISKTLGDLAGPLAFAAMMGISRIMFAKSKLAVERALLYGAILALIGYLTASLAPLPVINLIGCALCGAAVGVMWPGTLSLSAKSLPFGGTAMFALLALGGDLGCVAGPGIVGEISSKTDLRTGILFGTIFPVLMVAVICVYFACNRKRSK